MTTLRHAADAVRCARLEADAVALRANTGEPVGDERFTVAVAALESLRLDLLRLHAAASKGGGLTGDVEAVKQIGDAFAAQIEAADEVGRIIEPRR